MSELNKESGERGKGGQEERDGGGGGGGGGGEMV